MDEHMVTPKRHRRPSLTVGQWLALVVIGFFLGPLCVSNLWGYLQTRRDLTEAAFRNIRNVAALEASETGEFVRSAKKLLPSIVAGNQHLFRLLSEIQAVPSANQSPRLRHALHRHLDAKAQEGSSVEEFYVLGANGRLMASSDGGRAAGADLAESTCFRTGRRATGIAGFEYHEEHAHGHEAPSPHVHDHEAPQLVAAAPIWNPEGSFLGVLCGRFTFAVHRSLLLAHRERTSQANLYLLDERGQIVCGSFDDIHSAPFGEMPSTLEEAHVLSREGWVRFHRSGSGEELLVAYAPVPGLDWGILVETRVSNALADLERLKWQAVGASGLLAGVLALAIFFAWRTVVRPLHTLAQTSDRIASGAPGATVPPRGPRELHEVAAAFNRMSLALKEARDTLELRIAERTRELRESREFAELLLDSIDQRVVMLDRDYRIIKANATALRMRGSPLLGAPSYEVFEGLPVPPKDYPARNTFETGSPAAGERWQILGHGREVVYVETYPIFDPDRNVESVVEIARVVTSEKRLQMQMVHQEKMAAFGQLAAGLAHEIGNPLAAIQSQLRLAQRDPARAEHTIQVVEKQVGRIARLLRELVDFTRRRRDEVTLASVNQVVEDVVRLIEHDPRARNVEISRHLCGSLPGIRIKEDHLVQVLLNLGLNALDAIPGGGCIGFSTGREEDHVAIRVQDTGSGIPEEALPRIFEPFFTTKDPGRGTGLGLFVSRGTVENLGGSLDLEKTGPEGTTFVIRVPLPEAPHEGKES